jgi:hypothetical protein
MIHHTERTIELDPTAALALRDWLVTLSQRLGLDAAAATDAPTPPTSVAPEEIAPYLGELAFLLDASGCPDPETASVRITIASEPAVDSDRDPLVGSPLNVLDDRAAASETLPGLDDPCSDSYSPDTGMHGDADPDPDQDEFSIPARGYYVDPEHDARDYDLGIHAPLEDAIWTATPMRSPHSGGGPSPSDTAIADPESGVAASRDESADIDSSE